MKYFTKIILLCSLLVIVSSCNNKVSKNNQVENNTFGSYDFFEKLFKDNGGCIDFYGCYNNQISVEAYIDTNRFINICKEQFDMSGEFRPETNIVFKLPLYKISKETGNMEYTLQDMSLNGVYMTLEDEKQVYTISAFYQEMNSLRGRTRAMIFIKYRKEEQL
ncbi:MAG: hypothetical protein PF692_10550 [Kiritimatiellae bacterium]|jgi:hypothetical protein|nr:hypothetical protein [Kiritimatiellia bacterium]